jgi:hypothetical protein
MFTRRGANLSLLVGNMPPSLGRKTSPTLFESKRLTNYSFAKDARLGA